MSWIIDNVNQDIIEYLFNIRITLPTGQVVQRNVAADLTIDFDDLEKQLEETPEIISFFNMLLAEQTAVVAVLERNKSVLRGKIVEKATATAKDYKTEFRITDIKMLCESDDQIVEVDMKLVLENKKRDKLKAVVDALVKKSEHLRSLAGFKRDEKKEVR